MVSVRPLAIGVARGLFFCREVGVADRLYRNTECRGDLTHVFVGWLAGSGLKAAQVSEAHLSSIGECRLVEPCEFSYYLNSGPVEAELEALLCNYVGVVHDSSLARTGQICKYGKRWSAKYVILWRIGLAFLSETCQDGNMEIGAEVFSMMRIGAGLDPDEMAERLGVSRRTVANWESSGVPKHRNALVMSKFGSSIKAARDEVEKIAWEKSPEGVVAMESYYEEGFRQHTARENEHLVWDFLSIDDTQSVDEYLRLKKVVSGYSTASLSRVLASRLTDVERRDARLATHLAPSVGDDDPDYSNMTAGDAEKYGLAAFKGEGNIGFEDEPHET